MRSSSHQPPVIIKSHIARLNLRSWPAAIFELPSSDFKTTSSSAQPRFLHAVNPTVERYLVSFAA